MNDPAVLVINAGSSSIKFALYRVGPDQALTPWSRGQAEALGDQQARFIVDGQSHELTGTDHRTAIQTLLDWTESRLGQTPLLAAGHRVVHGGMHYAQAVALSPEIVAELEDLEGLAPLHQPHNLAAVRALAALRPELKQVACFDTAFHRSQPWYSQRFAIPREYAESGILRYGFHGLSYQYIAGWLRDQRPDLYAGRVIVAHLGNGASLCALKGGKSIATSMGFTALDGLIMGQRCGTIDPGVVLHLIRQRGMSAEEVEDLLYQHSGLLGMSGISHDVRTLLASDAAAAKEALQVYCYRAAREIASLVATLDGLDGLVFTAGVGENAAPVRAAICRQLGWLGIEIDARRNTDHAQDTSHPSSLPVLVVPTNEEIEIARETLRLAQNAT